MQSHPWKILYVDDNESDYLLARAMLQEARGDQVEVVWAPSFEAALPAIDRGDLEAILLDQQLGPRNGLELARYAVEHGLKAPIILITGFDSYELDVEAMQAGISDYLSKSDLRAPLLERTIRYAIERKRSENALLEAQRELELQVQVRTRELAGVVEDLQAEIVEREKTEQEIRRHGAQIQALAELSHMLAEAETDIQKVLDTITIWVSDLVGDTCTIALLSEDRQYLKAVAFYHPNPQAMQIIAEISKEPQRADEGLFQQVLQTSQPLLQTDIPQDQLRSSASPQYLPYLDHFGIFSLFLIPLRVQGQTIGTLAVSRDQPGRSYTDHEQWFLQEVAERAALGIFNAQLIHKLQNELAERKRVEQDLAELQRRLMDSVDIEGLHLAKKLHDEAIQGLYGVIFALEGMRQGLGEEQSEIQLGSVRSELQQVINLLRLIYQELRPPTLVPFGLDKAIEAHIDQFQQGHPELNVSLELMQEVEMLPERIGYILFRIFQHALSNAVRHAQPTQIHVRLWKDESGVSLEIQDNGQGFTVPHKWIEFARRGHYGLARAHERAEASGGKLEVDSRPSQGTTVRVRIPRSQLILERIPAGKGESGLPG